MDYKEILKGIVNIINTTENSDIGFTNICKYVAKNCPEFTESNDEKIRKSLIEQVVYIVPNDDEVDSEGNVLPTYQKRIDKYRAWLEKQGQTFTKKDIDDAYLKGVCDTKQELEKKELKKIEKKPGNNIESSVQNKYWNEEDEKILKTIIINIENLQFSEEMREKYLHIQNTSKNYYQIMAEWLKSLKDRFDYEVNCIIIKEWNEEDDFNLAWIVETLLGLDGDKEYTDFCKKIAKWLKSIRFQKQWEPSKEQIEALLKLEEMHVLEHEKTQENAHLYVVIKSLREQLLKLRKK